MKERVQLDTGETHEIEVKRITLICHHDQTGDVEPLDRLVLDPEATLYHADRLSPGGRHTKTDALIARVFKQQLPPVTSLAYRHVLGLVDLSLKLLDMNVPIAWRYPETYLHPAAQVELADILIELTEGR
jgi:hypothetical protein